MIRYCDGYDKDGSGFYCPLAEICYRCCDCDKSRNLRRYGKRFDGFFQYDKKTKSCINYMNKAQWLVIKMFSAK